MMGELLAIASGKGGVGKSALAVTLATQYALAGKATVLVDMNTGLRCLDMLMGLESRVAFDLGDVLSGACGLDRALVEERRSGVRLIAAQQFGEASAMGERTLRIILEVLMAQNDLVVLDMPTGTSPALSLAAEMAKETLLVTTPDDVSLRDTERVAAALRGEGRPSPAMVVNRLRADLVDAGLQYTPEVCAQAVDLRVMAAIPEDDALARTMLSKEPPVQGGAAVDAVDALRARLAGERLPLDGWRLPAEDNESTTVPEAKKRGFFARRKDR